MTNPLPFVLSGLVSGSAYGLAAVGLVFSYRISRTINFAHGAIAMFCAFSYWQFNVEWGWPAALALPVAAVAEPLAFGYLSERLVFRSLAGATIFSSTAASVALLLAIFGVSQWFWTLDFVRVPSIFPRRVVQLPGVVASTSQLGTVAVAAGLAAGTLLLLRATRTGLVLRAVVDRPELAGLKGIDARRAGRQAWMFSYLMAGVSGVLLAPLVGSNPLALTLLVIYALVAAALGSMRSLVMTFAGGILLGLTDAMALGYLPQGTITSRARGIVPFAVLFVALVAQSRRLSRVEQFGSVSSAAALEDLGALTGRRREPTRRGILLCLVLALAGSALFGDYWTFVAATGVAYACIFVSYTVFTATTGLVSLAQAAIAGVAAFTAAILVQEAGLPWFAGLLGGTLVAGITGAVVALPTVRLRGVYLVLATIAFAQLLESTLFANAGFSGGAFGREFSRPAGFDSSTAYLLLSLGMFLGLAWVGNRLRYSVSGRALQADLGCPAAARSIGIRPARARLLVFVVSSMIAGAGGVLLAGLAGHVSIETWNLLNGLIWFTLVAIGGIGSAWGALAAGLLFSLTPEVVRAVPALSDVYVALFGIGGLLFLRRPGGIVSVVEQWAAARRGERQRRAKARARLRLGERVVLRAASVNGGAPARVPGPNGHRVLEETSPPVARPR